MELTRSRATHRLAHASVLVVILCVASFGFEGAMASTPSSQGCQALISAPASASGGSAVAITDRSVAPEGARLTSRAWFFGNGSSLSGKNAATTVDHVYPVPAATMSKTYTISLLLSFSNGAQCSTKAPILIVNSAHQKSYTKLDLRGSTATTSVHAPIPNCGAIDATMSWIPHFGIEQTFPGGAPEGLFLFGTAVITSNGVTKRDPMSITVLLNYRTVVGIDPEYVGIAKLNSIYSTGSCALRVQRLGAHMVSVFYTPVEIKNGAAKLKCRPASSKKAATCKIDPSKTLRVSGAWGGAQVGSVDLHIHFSKEKCRYLGPAEPSPTSGQHARWYQCPKG